MGTYLGVPKVGPNSHLTGIQSRPNFIMVDGAQQLLMALTGLSELKLALAPANNWRIEIMGLPFPMLE